MRHLLVRGWAGSYWWTPVLQTVDFVPWRKRRPTWVEPLDERHNTEVGALRAALKHSLREMELA